MLTLIKGLPANVLGIEASGTITHADYRDTLIPNAEALAKHGKLRMLYILRSNIGDFELGALWDDTAFGIRHWRDFDRIALVTDHSWMRSSTSLFAPLIPGEVRVFGLDQLAAAKDWVAA